MIVITGGAGFIGSAVAWVCNQHGREDLLIVDDLKTSSKWQNLVGLHYKDYVHKDAFLTSILNNSCDSNIDTIIHMGACSSTTEENMDFLMENNYRYTKHLAEWCLRHKKRFIYASSAATYGNGELGFDDALETLTQLRPINRYGYSKQLFDKISLGEGWLDNIVGLKFFNVFGPNEYHKDTMKSVICKAYEQIQETGTLKLFKSYRKEFPDGGQMRDFVYVKDCAEIIWWLLENSDINGLFNIGTGQARTWNELANAVFNELNKPPNIQYIDMPDAIKEHYQYFTKASMEKLKEAGCPIQCRSLENAVSDYLPYLYHNQHLSTLSKPVPAIPK